LNMIMKVSSTILSILLCVKGSYSSPEYVNLFSTVSESESSENANYQCIFTNLWTKSRHPNDFPKNPHWSPPVVVSHDLEYFLFREGENATEGLESVAETGNTKKLIDEMKDAGDSILTRKVGNLMDGFSFKDSQKIKNIKLDGSHPYLSMISMVAPSPDWFTGLNDFDMRNGTGFWFQEVILDLFPWDAGTDAGTTYKSSDDDNDETVAQLTIDNIPQSSKVFESPEGVTVLPVARFQCKLNGAAAEKCKRISQKCDNKNKICCSGLVCMNEEGKKKKKKKCLPLRYEGQSCKKHSNICRISLQEKKLRSNS